MEASRDKRKKCAYRMSVCQIVGLVLLYRLDWKDVYFGSSCFS